MAGERVQLFEGPCRVSNFSESWLINTIFLHDTSSIICNSSIKQPAIAGYFSTALASISLDPLQRMFGKIPEDTP